ncbi:GHKL domain-containing protein [Inconstantimicrobium mannanitabidum]|uniref:GHKL domain-containing protein n=1 Tax=Inconstantimicrobium mannanitabidum TaxID=1604901 RepID=UPI0021C32576|nr:GHKL domain-containing protein [Clostridium sp. TW13]
MSKDKHLALLKYIKIIPLKALVSSKLIYAQSKGIETKIELIENIEKINIKTIDICRIIGILLDNAIEASLLCEKKLVHFAIVKNNNMTIFIINNSCINNIPPIYKLYEDNYSTKGKNHGIGLKTIRNIINNDYNNILLNTKLEDGLFKQELIIKENDN